MSPSTTFFPRTMSADLRGRLDARAECLLVSETLFLPCLDDAGRVFCHPCDVIADVADVANVGTDNKDAVVAVRFVAAEVLEAAAAVENG